MSPSHCRARVLSFLGLGITVLAMVSPAAAALVTFSVETGADDVRVERAGDAEQISLAGSFEQLSEPGHARLPYRIVRVLLPQGERVDDFTVTVDGRDVLRRQVRLALAPDRATASGERSNVVEASLVTGETVRYLGTGVLHGYAVAGFAVFPLELEGETLFLSPRIDVSVRTRPATLDVARLLRRRDGLREAARERALRGVANPEAAGAYVFDDVAVPAPRGGFRPTMAPALEGSPVDYVIVTRDSLAASFQELADFKTDKGVPTVVRTIEWIEANYRNGSDVQETIRTFVADAYAKWGISYLLLGGDTGLVPARLCLSTFHDGGRMLPVDLYYGGLDGDWNSDHDAIFGEHSDAPDLYAEVYVSRLPVLNSGDVAVLTGKVEDYENGVEPAYAKKALFLAEMLFPEDWQLGQPFTLDGGNLSEFVRLSAFTAPGLVTSQLYENYPNYPGSLPENKATAIDSINAGFGHVIHIGHGFRFNISVGDASILNAEAAALTNGKKQSNYFLLNCTAVSILFDCLGEVLMRNPDGGGVSVIGANESAFPTTSINYMYEHYELVMEQKVSNLARAFAMGREVRTPMALLSDNVHFWTHYINTVLGDAEMPLWSNQVATLAVSHAPTVVLGTTPITVTVLDAGSPVDSAVVCLSKDDDDYQVGTTNSSGQVTLNFRAEEAGTIKVVVTGHNYARHESSIAVGTGAGPYVSLSGMTVDDDNGGGTSGNGNGSVDAGETVDLWLTMTNSGALGSGFVDVVLRSPGPGVTVLDSTAAVGAVGAGGSVQALDAVRVSFDAGIGDESAIDFDLVVKQNSTDTWADEFKQVVAAPVLSKVTLRVDDSGSGNGNGVVDPNETFSLYYELKNFGTGDMPVATVNITDLDAGFVVTTAASAFAPLSPLSSAENVSGFVLREPDTSVEHRLEISVTDLYGRTLLDTFELRPPVPPVSAFIDPSLDPNQLRVTWELSASSDARHYNVYRSALTGGPYTRVNLDPVMHGAFVDRGLNLATEYFYMVTTIDDSGNESAASVEFAGSTNPPLLGGWPVTMAKESTSSPVFGDIDGDGDKELVTGDDKVYAWHADGFEVIDGDNDALTWGVLSPLGDEYTSHIALARMDGQPGLDIIAASRNTQEIYIFNHRGEVLPGWPKLLQTTVRAGMMAADINDDNIIEVVAVDELGTIYVFEPDGSEYRDGDNDPGTDGVFATLPGTTFLHYSTPAAADIDGDGMREIIVGSQADSLYAFNEDGTRVPGFPVALAADISGAAAVGDVDGDTDLEIVAFDASGRLRVYHHDGSVLYTRWFAANEVFFGPSPALGDITQNGKLEVFIPDKNGNLYAIDHTGADLPGWPVVYSAITYTESSPILADVDGDGGLDVIMGDEDRYIYAWNQSGSIVAGFPVTTGDAMRSVMCAADLDLDGDVDLAATGWDRSVYVWDFAGAWDESQNAWNSFHGNEHNDGLVGSKIPTGIGTVSFTLGVREGRVDLAWLMPVEAGPLFDLSRALVTGNEPGAYQRIAENLSGDATGLVRYADVKVRAGETYSYRITSRERDGAALDERNVYVPVARAALAQNYPNPFNPSTRIDYLVPDGGARRVQLVVYDVRGARVRSLVESLQPGGRYRVEWDGRDDRGQRVASGMYFYRLAQPGFTATRKMLMVK